MKTKEELKIIITKTLKKYGIPKAYLFGSILRDDFNDKSDVDILIDERPEKMDFSKLYDLIDDLESKTERKVDLLTKNTIRKHFAPYIINSATILYEQN